MSGRQLVSAAALASSFAATSEDCEDQVTVPVLPPDGVNVTTPNIARVYDCILGGKTHFKADRALAKEITDRVPGIWDELIAHRWFGVRATRTAAQAGIRQFLNIGTGLPTQNAVHLVAQDVSPDCRVAYVDNDPVVISHGRALLTCEGNAAMVGGDLREPARITADPAITRVINFDRPVALMLTGVLHHLPDTARPHDLVRTLVDTLAPGSAVVISHWRIDPEVIKVAAAYAEFQANESVYLRSPEEIRAFLDGTRITDPGVLPVGDWRPDMAPVGDPSWFLGGVGFVGDPWEAVA